MARRRKRFGAVTGRKSYPGGWKRAGYFWRGFDVRVSVRRARSGNRYIAEACVKAGPTMLKKCRRAGGKSVTVAASRALQHMASKLK